VKPKDEKKTIKLSDIKEELFENIYKLSEMKDVLG